MIKASEPLEKESESMQLKIQAKLRNAMIEISFLCIMNFIN
jgi:hypothetical protein